MPVILCINRLVEHEQLQAKQDTGTSRKNKRLKNIPLFCFNLDGYGLPLMKVNNQVSLNIGTLYKANKKGLTETSTFIKVC